MLELVWLIPAFPLAGFVLLVLIGRRLGEPLAGWLATAAVGGSFLATLAVFAGLVAEEPEERFYGLTLFEWIPAGNFSVDAGFFVDPLSMTMTLFVTGIATLIHLYAIGYMHGDANFSKFFIYLNLFVFSMLMLVLGDNMLLTFLGWEGVGACSYFLISFWFTDEANASAGKKAFVTNRIGDWGFMTAMFLTFFTVGSIRYVDVLAEANAGSIATVTATGIALLLFVGAIGKSAQLPLYVWLPDAMAGPTPVSALIHAATMVTAGVYLMVRTNPILEASYDWAPTTVAWVGAITALFAATAAVAQNDIKKVLAYSTVSQLGYLFLAVGVGGYVPAVFHMITHAFFKALLFLGSGSVIHGMHHEQDMRRYGGLMKLMPITAGTFIIGWLAIAGVPPFSGFWSKDEILAYAWEENKALWAIGLLTALLTAFYMSRQVFMTFFGRYRYADATPEEIGAAWDSRVDVARAEVDEAKAERDTAVAAIADARATITDAESKVAEAQTKVDEARVAAADIDDDAMTAALAAVEDAGDDKKAKRAADKAVKALEKPVKDLEKAEKALAKATDAVETTRSGVGDAEAEVARCDERVAAAQARVDVAAGEARDNRPTSDDVDLFEPPVTDGVDDLLPEAVAHRREFHPHESPWTMTLPLVLLAGGAMVAGVLNLPFTKSLHFLEHWLEPSLHGNEAHLSFGGGTKLILALVAIAAAAIGIAMAATVYLRGQGNRKGIELPILARAWGLDEAYAAIMGGPGRAFFNLLAWIDRTIVDGLVNGVAQTVRVGSSGLRVAQSGYVRNYALGVAVGAAALMAFFLSKAVF